MAVHSESQGLLSLTGDAFKSGHLERMVSAGNMTNSYKILWLRGVIEEVLEGAAEGACAIPFDRIVARMVAAAWYPIVYFRLSFGLQDKMGECVRVLRDATGLPNDASSQEIIAASLACTDERYRRCVRDRCKYVPHLLIRPFFEGAISRQEVENGKHLSDNGIRAAIVAASRTCDGGSLYTFNKEHDGVVVDAGWASYIRDNQHIICGWLNMRLVEYLQARNPSVPAIPLKIHPPQMRNLGAATKYWKEALELRPMREIYSGRVFDAGSFDACGPLSIDHFIPWSFVLHDEPWNLVPMFRDANSSKSDRLPDLESYLGLFADQQFDALMAVRNTGRHRKVLDAYLQIEPEIFAFDDVPACREMFADDIAKTIRPLHQIALNQGFSIWQPRADYAVVGF